MTVFVRRSTRFAPLPFREFTGPYGSDRPGPSGPRRSHAASVGDAKSALAQAGTPATVTSMLPRVALE